MSNVRFEFVFSFFLFFACFSLGSSLTCYHCSEYLSTGIDICKDPLHKTIPAKECLQWQVCVKHETPAMQGMPEKTYRDCAASNYCETHAKKIEEKLRANSLHCSICSENLCNSSYSMFASLTIISLSILAYFIF